MADAPEYEPEIDSPEPGKPALVAIDARFDEQGTAREEVHIQRIPTILPGTACPGSQVN